MGEMMKQIPPEAFDDGELKKVENMINHTAWNAINPTFSMTLECVESRWAPDGTLSEVKALQERFMQTRKMMAQMGKSGMSVDCCMAEVAECPECPECLEWAAVVPHGDAWPKWVGAEAYLDSWNAGYGRDDATQF